MAKIVDSEKITINLGLVDLGRIDLMVTEGYYANRTDLIRTAIRNQLDRHQGDLDRFVARRGTALGLRQVSRPELEELRAKGEMLDLDVLGLLNIAEDVSAELALATVRTVHVLGALQASPAVKTALAGRVR